MTSLAHLPIPIAVLYAGLAGTGLALVIASFVMTYPGVAPSMALTTDLVVGSVPPEKAGGASGLATTANDLGISLGVAVIGSVGLAAYRSRIDSALPDGLPPEAAAAASDSVDGALASAADLPAALGEQLIVAAQEAFAGGLNTAAAVSAAIDDGLLTIDGMGTIRSFNPAAQRIFGHAPEEIIGQSLSALLTGTAGFGDGASAVHDAGAVPSVVDVIQLADLRVRLPDQPEHVLLGLLELEADHLREARLELREAFGGHVVEMVGVRVDRREERHDGAVEVEASGSVQQIEALRERLSRRNPGARLFGVVKGNIAPDELFGASLTDPGAATSAVTRWLSEAAFVHAEEMHHHAHPHDRDRHEVGSLANPLQVGDQELVELLLEDLAGELADRLAGVAEAFDVDPDCVEAVAAGADVPLDRHRPAQVTVHVAVAGYIPPDDLDAGSVRRVEPPTHQRRVVEVAAAAEPCRAEVEDADAPRLHVGHRCLRVEPVVVDVDPRSEFADGRIRIDLGPSAPAPGR